MSSRSAFSGGAAVRDLDGSYCSTAFGVHRRSGGARLLLTASHCVDVPCEQWSQGAGGLVVGTGRDRSTNTDSGIIEPVNSLFTSGNRIYIRGAAFTGAGTNGFSMRITGRGVGAVDRMTLANGAMTGQRSSMRITHSEYEVAPL